MKSHEKKKDRTMRVMVDRVIAGGSELVIKRMMSVGFEPTPMKTGA
jgi:hypothetical protein